MRDWERRLKYAPFEEKNRMMRRALAESKNIFDIQDSPKWKYITEKKGNKVFTMDDETTGLKKIKGQATIPWEPIELFFMITNLEEEVKGNDPLFAETRILEKIGPQTLKIY